MTTRAQTIERAPKASGVVAKAQVMIVDDDALILRSLTELLRDDGYGVSPVSTLEDAVKLMERQPVDVIVSDINMPGGNGFELLHTMRKRWPDTAVIMMTAYGTIESAVEAMRMGAFDYVTKPINDDELQICIERAESSLALVRENRALRDRLDQKYGLDHVIGQDFRMARIFELVESIADSKITVLIQGASGTGKTLLANAIHQRSNRRDEAFVEVSCGAIPESLLESELFGHVRGAFTGAVANKAGKFKAAHRGTIFLDEIAMSSPSLQVKLLRVLQSQQFEPVGSNKTETVDVRVILATNVDLESEVRAGRFREDLFYRINVVTIDMPKLSDRLGDIPLLANQFLQRFAASMNRELRDFDEAAMAVLQRYSWPGNVRELENVIERAVVLAKGHLVGASDLPEKLLRPEARGPVVLAEDGPRSLDQAMEEPERRIIEAALNANHWNRQATAQQLNINRTTLYKKMKRYGLERR